MVEVSNNDAERIMRILHWAAEEYNGKHTQRDTCRLWVIKQMAGKMKKKIKRHTI